MDLHSFFKDETLGGSWGDSPVDELPSFPSQIQKPKHAIPENPPYTAYLGNLAFATSQQDIENVFVSLKIASVRLITHDDKPKGFAYVEFQDRTSLEKALDFNDVDLNGRKLKIDVAERLFFLI